MATKDFQAPTKAEEKQGRKQGFENLITQNPHRRSHLHAPSPLSQLAFCVLLRAQIFGIHRFQTYHR